MFEDKNGDWFNNSLPDGGPVYMETNYGQWIVEPWNAISSLLMLIPAIYWIYRMKKINNQSLLMWIVIVLVITGGIGSSLFHAFRAHVAFLIMDVLPSAILTITLSVYFWIKVFHKWWYVLLVFIPFIIIRFLLFSNLPEHTAINLAYFMTGASIGIPLIIYLIKTSYSGWKLVLAGILSFAVALMFREFDYIPMAALPMGTHFLWHSFSAVGAYFIIGYLFMVQYTQVNRPYSEV